MVFELTARQRTLIKYLLFLSIIISLYFGLTAVYVDLYNPGSQLARTYNDIVNWIFVLSFILALPLLYDKILRGEKWLKTLNTVSPDERQRMKWGAVKPVLKQITLVVVLVIIASIVLPMVWQIPPEVVRNYQNYYSYPKEINISSINNISMNLTKARP